MPHLALLLAASLAAANDFSVANILGAIRDNAGTMPDIAGRSAGAPLPSQQDPFARALAAEGVWGDGKGDPLPERLQRAQGQAVTPLNLGFQALGPKGAKGRIVGPHPLGFANGTYEVFENSPFHVVIGMNTGYIDGRFSLKRDPVTGKDVMGFSGRLLENGDWGAPRRGANDGLVTYDPNTDSGTIRWLMRGEWRQDAYSRGRAGGRAMYISLSGNKHEFHRE